MSILKEIELEQKLIKFTYVLDYCIRCSEQGNELTLSKDLKELKEYIENEIKEIK